MKILKIVVDEIPAKATSEKNGSYCVFEGNYESGCCLAEIYPPPCFQYPSVDCPLVNPAKYGFKVEIRRKI